MDVDVDQRIRDIQREYLNFLDDEDDQGIYSELVKDMITNKNVRLIVDINDLRRKLPQRAAGLLENAFEEQGAFQKALMEFVAAADATYAKDHEAFFVGFEGSFGSRHVSPRSLTSKYLGNMVCCEGIVTKCSLIRPKVVRSVHYCPATKKTMERKYADLTSFEAYPTSGVYPTKDEDGNPLETEYGLSTYKDHQTLSIQEMPEKAPAGQLPRSVDIILDNDLVDACKPGDRVQIVGTFRCLPSKQGGVTSGSFRTVLIANNVCLLSKEANPCITAEDVRKCKRFAKSHGGAVFDKLAHSIAPSIHGHEYIKKAVLCMLLGGLEKHLPNGTRLRGDINILLIGDPSVAKSQLLRYVLHTAPRAITTTGRGSSGVGLTAAVTSDPETGERRLEAGAMVLADRGIVCIDEFDKMSDIDRTAIHEVMEQGRVTISKAGIHAQLNARCSVLAAANPVYGRYDQYRAPMENIGMQDSLLSRFDLLFIVLDQIDPENDRRISDHVLSVQTFRGPGEQDGEPLPLGLGVDILTTRDLEKEDRGTEGTVIYEKQDLIPTSGKRDQIVSLEFLRKYIHIARVLKPQLTDEASEAIANEYARLRSYDTESSDVARTQPVTARALETLIRLSTAHAKARLSKSVEIQDAKSAIELVQFAYFKKVLEREKLSRSRKQDDVEDDDMADENESQTSSRKKKGGRQVRGSQVSDPYEFDGMEEEEEIPPLSPSSGTRTRRGPRAVRDEPMDIVAPGENLDSHSHIQPARLKAFKATLTRVFRERRAQRLPAEDVKAVLDLEYTGPDAFTTEEVNEALQKMEEDNQIMQANNWVYLI